MEKISPCKNCTCKEDRKICSETCQALAEYREWLGDPFWDLGISTLGSALDGSLKLYFSIEEVIGIYGKASGREI